MLSPDFYLAAAAVMVAAIGGRGIVATATEQDQQNDDPAQITATVVIKHKKYLRNFLSGVAAHSKIFRSFKKVTTDEVHLPARFWMRSFRPSS